MRDKHIRPALIGLITSLSLGAGLPALAQDNAPPQSQRLEMTGDRLLDIIRRIDENAQIEGNFAQFAFADTGVAVVFDENAKRMRIIVPIAPTDVLSERLMERMLQANYDAVLDARYAISQGQVWSVYIHPLDTLTEVDFTSGLVQTVIAAQTFGREFTSGALVFGGGDSAELNQQLQDALDAENDRGI